MGQSKLPIDRLEVLSIVREAGASICVGTCEHRKPGELHCHHISQQMKISASGVKRRLRELARMGLLTLERTTREDGKVIARYTVSPDGLKLLKAEPATADGTSMATTGT